MEHSINQQQRSEHPQNAERRIKLKQFKEDIKTFEKEQKFLKEERKSVRYTGHRIHDPSEAARLHSVNRYDLRHMYIAYGFIRGKKIEQIETLPKRPPYRKYSESYIESIISKYNVPEYVQQPKTETVYNNS